MKSKKPAAWFDSTVPDWEDQYLDQGLRGRQVRKRMALTLEYLDEERLPPRARILDLGCGPGIIAEEFASRGFRVSCVDFSSELLLRTCDRLKGRGCALPHLVQADAHALPFKNGVFDAIVCVGVISWVADPAKVLRETARVLRPGGALIITARNKLSVENLFDPLFWWRWLVPLALRTSLRALIRRPAAKQGEEAGPRVQQFQLRRFDKMLQSAGLTKTRWRTIKYGHFRFFGRHIFPVRVEVAIDRALDRICWVPTIRSLGWLYCAKAKRETGGTIVPAPFLAASHQGPKGVRTLPTPAISPGSDTTTRPFVRLNHDAPSPSTEPVSVLILGNYRQSLTLTRSLAKARFRIILGTHKERESAQYSRHVSEIWKHPPIKSNAESFVASLTAFVMERPDISWVFPVGETQLECLARHIDEIPFRSRLVMADPSAVLTCLNKTSLYRIASELGIPSPEFLIAHDHSQLLSIAERIGYPLIVKPNSSLRQFFDKKAIICRTFTDLRDSFDSWPEGNEFLIVQKYVHGERHNCHFAAISGRSRAHFQWITSRTNCIDNTGIAVEGISVRPIPVIEGYCDQILKRLNYSGVGCIQFILDEKTGVAYFLELNPRLGATCAFPYRLGFDFPKMAVECVTGREEEMLSAVRCSRTYPIGKRVHWLLGDLEGLVAGVKNGGLGFSAGLRWLWRMAKAFVRADVHVTWDWRDPVPTVFLYARLPGFAWRRLRRVVSRKPHVRAEG